MTNILYLLNHKTLTDFECPILIKNNIFPYIPKSFHSLSNINSINYKSIYFYDNFLNIPINIIQQFNTLDWFKNKNTVVNNINLLNTYFKVIFITLLTDKETLKFLIDNFNGNLYFRFFGLGNKQFYYNVCKQKYGNLFLSNKVKFIFSYKEIIKYEKSKYKYLNDNNHLFIPLGLSNNFFVDYYNTYNPIYNKIIFVCSRLDEGINSYYGKIYQKFISDFKDKDFYKEISNHKCMFYHSNEELHLHYHPLEAFIIGVPVVFSSKSLLTTYINESPAIYNSIDEAKNIITKILNNDSILIENILKKQKNILYKLRIQENNNIFHKLKIDE